MPGTNSFYPYGENSTNILNNSEYQTDTERTTGAQSGAIARSKMYNKQARQAAAGAYAVGALVAKSGKNADDSSAATLATNFQAAVNYQAAHFVASDVSVSGTTATATVAELATTAAADLPALFALSLVLDQALPAGASIAIASSLPDVTLSWPIYVGSEVLDSDTITGGAITLLIDTVGAKAFFRAGGMGKLPSDLAPLCPNFKVERNGGKIKVSADKIQLNSYTNMVSGGVWAWGKTRPTKPTGENTKLWSRAELITTEKPYDGLYLGDVTPSDAVTETLIYLPEKKDGKVVLEPFVILSTDYLGGVYLMRKYLWMLSTYTGKYPQSNINTLLLSGYKTSVLVSDISAQVMVVPLPVYGESGDIYETDFFIPSMAELNFGTGGDIPTEGTMMPYFSSVQRRYAYVSQEGEKSGAKQEYWSRTGSISNSTSKYYVNTDGGKSTSGSTSTQWYIRPCFILPKDFKIQQRPDGSYTVWNEQGLMTLGDIEASNTSTTSIVNVTESGQLSPFILLSQKYGDKNVSVLHREDLLPESWNSNYSGTTDYASSGIQTKFEEYASSTLDAPYRALLVSVEVTYKNLNPSDNWERKLSTKCCAIGAEEVGIVSGWDLGNIFSYYESSENRKKKHDDGSYAQWYTRDIQSEFSSSNRAWDDRKPYSVNASGTTSGVQGIGHDNGLCPMLFFETTSPIRALADGSYDLVPEDPALSAQSISTMADEEEVPLEIELDWPEEDPLIARQWVYNTKGVYQTMLLGGVASTEDAPAFELPVFTGNHAIFGDETAGRIELYESGDLTLSPGTYDFFLVGGGGAGYRGRYSESSDSTGGGGAGGKTFTQKAVTVPKLTVCPALVGAGGSQSGITVNDSNFSAQAGGGANQSKGGSGGSGGGGGGEDRGNVHGGSGGSDGSNGADGYSKTEYHKGGTGQGTTTKSFGEVGGTLYAGGGGGGACSGRGAGAAGGAGGGGAGGNGSSQTKPGAAGTPNTGGGGGGGADYTGTSTQAGAGGSGIIIVRWNNAAQ